MPLSDSITLPVDVLNNGTLANQVITLKDSETGRKTYKFANNTFTSRDLVTFTRSYPKPNGNFAGTRKSSFKLTQDVIVDGVDPSTDVKAPGILEISSSLPVGLDSATALQMRQRAIAILDAVFFIAVQESCEV